MLPFKGPNLELSVNFEREKTDQKNKPTLYFSRLFEEKFVHIEHLSLLKKENIIIMENSKQSDEFDNGLVITHI